MNLRIQISKEGRSVWQEKQYVSHAIVRTAAIQHVIMLLF